MKAMMLKLYGFSHNHHPGRVKMLAKIPDVAFHLSIFLPFVSYSYLIVRLYRALMTELALAFFLP
jgi:hypothetical protein